MVRHVRPQELAALLARRVAHEAHRLERLEAEVPLLLELRAGLALVAGAEDEGCHGLRLERPRNLESVQRLSEGVGFLE